MIDRSHNISELLHVDINISTKPEIVCNNMLIHDEQLI
jgi:hypothetical protein